MVSGAGGPVQAASLLIRAEVNLLPLVFLSANRSVLLGDCVLAAGMIRLLLIATIFTERGRTLPRLGNPKVTLVLALLVVAAAAVKAEVWPESKAPPLMAETRLLVQQGKMVGPDAENAPTPQEECPNANPVWDDVATGDLETDLFETSTDRLVVSYEVLERARERGLPSFRATIEDEDGRSISSGKIPSPQPGDPFVKISRPTWAAPLWTPRRTATG